MLIYFETFIKEFIRACRHHSTKSRKLVFDTVPLFCKCGGGATAPSAPTPGSAAYMVAKPLTMTYVSIPKVNISWVVPDVDNATLNHRPVTKQSDCYAH